LAVGEARTLLQGAKLSVAMGALLATVDRRSVGEMDLSVGLGRRREWRRL
jgi:hypothetical protein